METVTLTRNQVQSWVKAMMTSRRFRDCPQEFHKDTIMGLTNLIMGGGEIPTDPSQGVSAEGGGHGN